MSIRQFLRLVPAALIILSGLAADAQSAVRPNILFIMADDHNRQSISAYSGRYKEIAPTPNIDRLAKEGMRFDRMAASNSLCVPSRAVLITGKYSHLNGVKTNGDEFDGGQQTFPKLMQQAGYQTALFGKWHLKSQPTGFDHYAVIPGQGRFTDCPFLETGEPWNAKGNTAAKGYLTDVITDKSIAWLKARPQDKPFCIMVHHKAPHVPHQPAPRHEAFLEDVVLPEPSSLLDDYAGRAIREIEDTTRYSRLAINAEGQYRELAKKFEGNREQATREIYQAFFKGYLRLVRGVDENVGRLLDYLDEAGLRENTVVIYTSDNGFFSGEHGFYNKMWMYEESLHLPLLVRYPGVVAPGSECSQLTSMLDIAPTFLDLSGAAIPADLQGASLLPLLRGGQAPVRDAVYYHFYEQFGTPEMVGVRTGTHKLVHYPGLAQVQWELFDLENDPTEMENLAGKPEFRPLLDGMKATLAEKAVAVGDPIAASLAANPAAPVRVLLLSGQNNHPWQATTPTLQGILEATGKFKVTVTESPHQLTPADFAAADVIVSNWNAWTGKKGKPELTGWPESVRDAYVAFVRGGGGHVVVHAGSSSFYDWPEYHQICLATWDLGTTGHGPPHEFAVRIDDSGHPVTAGVAGFKIHDELWHRPNVAEGAKTLASSFSSSDHRGTGEWEPCVLVGQFGEGRCFTILLGHTAGKDGQYMDNPGFQQLFARGVEWVAPSR